MTLGEKMRQARLEAGLSQGQLCQGLVTRNMLSQIEHDTARPSLSTLQELASRLGKPVQYFFEASAPEDLPSRLEPAKQRFAQKNWQEALDLLLPLQESWEQQYLAALCHLHLAEEALSAGQADAALLHLQNATEFGAQTPYFAPALSQYTQQQIARIQPSALPEDDTLLLLRADAAIRAEEWESARQLLSCVQTPGSAGWHYMKGLLAEKDHQWGTATAHFRLGESWNPKASWEHLEICARESGDFQSAYHYACKLRDL